MEVNHTTKVVFSSPNVLLFLYVLNFFSSALQQLQQSNQEFLPEKCFLIWMYIAVNATTRALFSGSFLHVKNFQIHRVKFMLLFLDINVSLFVLSLAHSMHIEKQMEN